MLGRFRRQTKVDDAFWREAVVLAAIAERAAPIIELCAEPDFIGATLPQLDSVWRGVSAARRADGPNPLRRLERLLGPEEPDDDTPTYLAVAALEGLYAAAVMAFRLERFGDPIEIGQDIHSALDGVVQFTRDPRPIFVDPRNPPPPGPFEAREYSSCRRDQDDVSGASFNEAAAAVRARARSERETLRGNIRRALAEVRAFERDW
jgi:hypothetical protein